MEHAMRQGLVIAAVSAALLAQGALYAQPGCVTRNVLEPVGLFAISSYATYALEVPAQSQDLVVVGFRFPSRCLSAETCPAEVPTALHLSDTSGRPRNSPARSGSVWVLGSDDFYRTTFERLTIPAGRPFFLVFTVPVGSESRQVDLRMPVAESGSALSSNHYYRAGNQGPWAGPSSDRWIWSVDCELPCTPPGISTHPAGRTACAGGSATFQVAASGTAPLSFQWRFNGVNIPGATGPSHTINPVQASHAGDYDVVVSNPCGSRPSNGATLSVLVSPAITMHPASQLVCVGAPAGFQVQAAGSAPLAYQWRKNLVDIPGATSSSYTISSVALADAGAYDVVVGNDCGSVASSPASLGVRECDPPRITTHPESHTLCEGGTMTFFVLASGSSPLSYQWRKGGQPIPGATAATYTIDPVQLQHAGIYDVRVSNPFGSDTSNPATLTVATPPGITQHPAGQMVCTGSPVTFSVVATGGPLSYQWQKNLVDIPGATGPSYTIAAVSPPDAGFYAVRVSNICGTRLSSGAQLVVVPSCTTRPCVERGSPTTRVNVSSSCGQANAWSNRCSVTGNGRLVAFESLATNLALGVTLSRGGIYVRDRGTDVTYAASLSSTDQPPDDFCQSPSFSADGRVVAFSSHAGNLAPGAANMYEDVFVRDLVNRLTTLEIVPLPGQWVDGHSRSPSLSADGSLVAFQSLASTLVSGDLNRLQDIFVRDRVAGMTTRVSVSSAGAEADGAGETPAISGDGRFVTFASDARNLVPGDRNLAWDVFVHERGSGATTRVSVSSAGQEAWGQSRGRPAISRDGRFVAFASLATNLVEGDTNGVSDVFVHDRDTRVTARVSVSSAGVEANGASTGPALSADGRFVAFSSEATNLVPGDTNGAVDVFLHDRQTGTTTRASVSMAGEEADGASSLPAISAGGGIVAFTSSATNLVPGDTNAEPDVFAHDRGAAGMMTRDLVRPGGTVGLRLFSPGDAGGLYVAAASLGTTPGIPVDSRVIPLNPDPLLVLSLTAPSIFRDFVGALDGSGRGSASIALPPEPALVGLTFHSAFVTIRPPAPSGIGAISNPWSLLVEP